MISQKESKYVRMGTWLLKLLSRALKNEDQSKNGHKI